MLSQRPGPQGGGSWAHSSTSSSHAEPRKPTGQTQRKEPGRFSQTPRPQSPGLWVHSSTSVHGKGPRVTAPLCPHPTPLCVPGLHHSDCPSTIPLPHACQSSVPLTGSGRCFSLGPMSQSSLSPITIPSPSFWCLQLSSLSFSILHDSARFHHLASPSPGHSIATWPRIWFLEPGSSHP